MKLIAGSITLEGQTTQAPILGLSTEPLYLDVRLPAGRDFSVDIPAGHEALVYVYEGRLHIGERIVNNHRAAILSDGDYVILHSQEQESRFLILAGKPIGEPVVQYGPFVMNTRAEIEQAVSDYQNGRLTLLPNQT